ncbi:MAG: 3-hydroxybutyryl-CoA dehydrogenase [Nitrososphaerota archaeon]|jgi:enoyl-CoA hydratase/3-hydroxyacyl-CoA dehydrogenase|nr:3-hydroxybutyryl-CoA dehydrogenase [Nitrososphaerota archaeon]MDG7039866.1 3-hydroxybutyryl-CoA dehydrogenase [Nitrososphaerota archaeon]
MNNNRLKKISIIGAGTMGHWIAETAIQSGLDTILFDINEKILNDANKTIKEDLIKASPVKNSKDVDVIYSRLRTSLDIKEASNVDFIIEAIPEILKLKKKVFNELDALAPSDTIFASNTSSLPITELSFSTKRPSKFIGVHFFSPKPLVEIIRGKRTDDNTFLITQDLANSMGKVVVSVQKDVPGFIVNRVQGRMFNDACWLLYYNKAQVNEIDNMVKEYLGFPIGIFELADLSGIDIIYHMLINMKKRGYKIHICPIFEEKVKLNQLGIKAKEGFYYYSGKSIAPASVNKGSFNIKPLEILAPMLNEIAWIIGNKVASKEDVETAFINGLGFTKLLDFVKEFGLTAISKELENLMQKTKWIEYKPSKYLTLLKAD